MSASIEEAWKAENKFVIAQAKQRHEPIDEGSLEGE